MIEPRLKVSWLRNKWPFQVILLGSAVRSAFVARRGAKGMAVVLAERCNAVHGRGSGGPTISSNCWERLPAPSAALRSLTGGGPAALARLAERTGRRSEPGNITWKGHKWLNGMLYWAVLVGSTALADGWQQSGHMAAEYRYFTERPQFARQLEGGQASLVFAPEFERRDGPHRFRLALHGRIDDRDPERSHVDIREAYWLWLGREWELLVGINTVFWGVTESRHLVDVVNQLDLLEDIDAEDKLGQPMIQLATQQHWGRLELFVLPFFREREFAGPQGRLRPGLPVDEDATRYERGNQQKYFASAAIRYTQVIGDADLGLHYFHGSSREPQLMLRSDAAGSRLVPFYAEIDQLGIDLQYTVGSWLWKFEGIGRRGQGKTFGAAVAGVEYSFYQVFGSGADLGLLAEYQWDGRDDSAPPTSADNDLFLGLRLGLNDTQNSSLLAGATVDSDSGAMLWSVEAARRLSHQWTLDVQIRGFSRLGNASSNEPVRSLRRDDFINLRISRHFL